VFNGSAKQSLASLALIFSMGDRFGDEQFLQHTVPPLHLQGEETFVGFMPLHVYPSANLSNNIHC
jgi:hypothetical protein